MNINRHNYEEFFILYMDNELSNEDRQAVETFVAANPDLKAELEYLSQTKLFDEDTIVFNDKSTLLRSASSNNIHAGNTADWLVLYVDLELTADEMQKADQVLSQQPEIRKELDLLLQTKTSADISVVYPNKAELYRKEEAPVIAFSWKRIAVAAVLVLAIGSATYLNFVANDEELIPTKGAVAEQKVAPVTVTPSNKTGDTKATVTPTTNNNSSAATTNKVESIESVETNQQATLKPKNSVANKAVSNKVESKNETKNVVTAPKSNDLPKATNNSTVNTIPDTQTGNTVAHNDNSNKPALTFPEENKSIQDVTKETPQALYTTNSTTSSNNEIDADDSGKKSKFRGFFRKVTRKFEKNTGIKATDDEDRLLIGAVAIKL